VVEDGSEVGRDEGALEEVDEEGFGGRCEIGLRAGAFFFEAAVDLGDEQDVSYETERRERVLTFFKNVGQSFSTSNCLLSRW